MYRRMPSALPRKTRFVTRRTAQGRNPATCTTLNYRMDVPIDVKRLFALFASVAARRGPGVGAGPLAVAKPADGDHVQRPVGLPVAAWVEPVAARAPGREAGIGLAPQMWAKAASLRKRSMFCPAVTSS